MQNGWKNWPGVRIPCELIQRDPSSRWDHPNLWKRESQVKSREPRFPKNPKKSWEKGGFEAHPGAGEGHRGRCSSGSQNNEENKENKGKRKTRLPCLSPEGSAHAGSRSTRKGLSRIPEGWEGGSVPSRDLQRFPGNGNVQPGILTGSCLFSFLFYLWI